jgi:hypothetical protein
MKIFPLTFSVPLAIIGGAVIIGASIFGSSYFDRYQIATSVSNDTAIAWILNKRTGNVFVCNLVPSLMGEEIPNLRSIDKVDVQCGF